MLSVLVFLLKWSPVLLLKAPPLPQHGVRLFLANFNKSLSNYAMVPASQFRVDDLQSRDNISDAIWCQAAPTLGLVHYQWYGPGGLDDPVQLNTTLENITKFNYPTTFVVVEMDQVGLARPSGTHIGDNEGLYQCVITVNQTNLKHTLVVGVYKTSSYNSSIGPVITSSIQFFLMSSRNAEPPQFILTFNVSDAPATTVYCNVNDVPIGNMTVSRGILNGKPPTLTNVAVTIRQRIAGVYNCTVSNNRVEDNTVRKPVAYSGHAVVNIKVADVPQNVTISRSSSSSYLVTWTAPSTTPVAGYEVFYETTAGKVFSMGNTTQTNFTLCGLDEGDTYFIFVVAHQGENFENSPLNTFWLPSARSTSVRFSGRCTIRNVIPCMPTVTNGTDIMSSSNQVIWIAVCVLLATILLLSCKLNILAVCLLTRRKTKSNPKRKVAVSHSTTNLELNCELYASESIHYEAIQEETNKKLRSSISPYAFTSIKSNSGDADEKNDEAEPIPDVEECLYDNPKNSLDEEQTEVGEKEPDTEEEEKEPEYGNRFNILQGLTNSKTTINERSVISEQIHEKGDENAMTLVAKTQYSKPQHEYTTIDKTKFSVHDDHKDDDDDDY